MDEYSGKRAVNGFVVSRERSRLVQDAQFCNRLGYSGRQNLPRAKSTGSSLSSSSCGQKLVRSSTRTCSAMKNTEKSLTEPLRMLSEVETDSSETDSIQDEPVVSDIIPVPLSAKCKRGLHVNPRNLKSTDFKMMEVGSSSGSSNVKPEKKFGKQCEESNQDAPADSSFSLRTKSRGQGMHVSSGCKKEFNSNSFPSIPSGRSLPDQNLSRGKNVIEQRRFEGDSRFFARGKKMSGSSSGRNSNGIFLSDSSRVRNIPPNREYGDISNRSRSTTNPNAIHMTRFSPSNGNSIPLHQQPSTTSQMPQSDLFTDRNVSGSCHRYSSEPWISRSISLGQTSSNIGNLRSTRPSSKAEVCMTYSSANSDISRLFRINEISQVLLALERIGQNEELTYEQVFLLETNLFLIGLNDQHRDMRMDIDNMSYEELLALEERMGSVSTALSEEETTECLKRSIYNSTSTEGGVVSSCEDSDDFKCCICQEDYASGDEIGNMQCQHKFHMVCIHKWLRLKNWCPVCKSSSNEGKD